MADRYEYVEIERFRVVKKDYVFQIYKEVAISYYTDIMCSALNYKPSVIDTGNYKIQIRKHTQKGRCFSYIPGNGSMEIETWDKEFINKLWYNANNYIEFYDEFERKLKI